MWFLVEIGIENSLMRMGAVVCSDFKSACFKLPSSTRMSGHLRRRLAQLEVQIVAQRRVLEKLQQTRSDVESELHATATYPVSKLPTEIAAEIFGHCVQVFDPVLIPRIYKMSVPIILSAVCRTWRD